VSHYENYLELLRELSPAGPLALSMMLATAGAPAQAEQQSTPQATGVADRLAAIRGAVSTLIAPSAATDPELKLAWANWSNWSNWRNVTTTWSNAAGAIGGILEGLGSVLQNLPAPTESEPARAQDACDVANEQYNSLKRAANEQTDAKLAELGLVPTRDQPLDKACKYLTFLNWLLPVQQTSLIQSRSPISICAQLGHSIDEGPNPPETVIASANADIPKYTQLCQQYTAAQAAPQPIAQNQAATTGCGTPPPQSDVTGLGPSPAPTAARPAVPCPVIPQQTATAPPPRPAPTQPPSAAQNPADFIQSFFTPQQQPTVDRDNQARVQFDLGQAALNANNCADAAAYFTKAVSLTASYASTYQGWLARAQACAPQAAAPTVVTTQLTVPLPPDQLTLMRQKCQALEDAQQSAAVSCWGGFSDLAYRLGQKDLAEWAKNHLDPNKFQGCAAQTTMPIAPGCNFDYPIRLTGDACGNPNNLVGWTTTSPNGPVCCTKSAGGLRGKLACGLQQQNSGQ
jgi:hypothetical protein